MRHDIRAKYEGKMATRPADTISNKDVDIQQRSQRLLVSEFSEVAASSRLAVTMMKTILSYVHVLSGSDNLTEKNPSLLYLLVPILSVFQAECDKGNAAFMVERYCGLLTMARPDVLTGADPMLKLEFDQKLIACLEPRNAELAAMLRQSSGPSIRVVEAILSTIRTCYDQMFVGISPMDVVLFIWDQSLVSRLGTEDPHVDLLMPLCAAVLTLPIWQRDGRHQLLMAVSDIEVNDAIRSVGASLSIGALQNELEHGYKHELVNAGMPSFEVSGDSDAPFLFADDMDMGGGNKLAEGGRAAGGQKAAPAWLQAAAGGGGGGGGGGQKGAPAAPQNPLIQAMAGEIRSREDGVDKLNFS